MDATFAYEHAERHPLVQAYRGSAVGSLRIDTSIASLDETFYAALNERHGHRGQALVWYFRGGFDVWRIVERLLSWGFGDVASVSSMLDFASGFGRSTRYLVARIPATRIWVADVQEDAVAFQERQFAVHGLLSDVRPRKLRTTRRFAAVFSFSFFSHVPPERFVPWMRRLWTSLEDDGLFAFTALDLSALPPGRQAPAGGAYFERVSDSTRLPLEDYGTTWVTEGFVRQCLQAACEGEWSCQRFERAVWHSQDLYLVARGSRATLPPLDLPQLVEGYLDTCHQQGPRHLALHGWASAWKSADHPEIRVSLNGHCVATCVADLPRDDVARAKGDRFARTGWYCTVDSPKPLRPDDVLLVKALSRDGSETILHVSFVEGADTVSRASRARWDAQERCPYLESKVAAMEQSRFWRIRNHWFRLKGLVRSRGAT